MNDHTPELGIAIEAEVRGKGLGTKLMRSIIEKAKNNSYKALSLSVAVDNIRAIKLYCKSGFVGVAREGTSITMLLK